MGLAAPQINIGRAAAVIQTPDGELITLLNPRICDQSAAVDERYEGCLSFFEVRGMVPRPLAIEVEHQDTEGNIRLTAFERGVARLVCHEVDTCSGLCTGRGCGREPSRFRCRSTGAPGSSGRTGDDFTRRFAREARSGRAGGRSPALRSLAELRFVVVGTYVADCFVNTSRLPAWGHEYEAHSIRTSPGGKALN